MKNEKELNEILENWNTFESVVETLEIQEVKEACLVLLSEQSERIMTCPYSTKRDYGGAFPGGLVYQALTVYKLMADMRKTFNLQDEVNMDSVVLLSLFYGLGKIGNETFDYYVPQTSEWHKDKLGQMYEINEKFVGSSVSSRSLWWLNSYQVALRENEVSAILSLGNGENQISTNDSNYHESWETVLLKTAVKVANLKNKKLKFLVG